MIRYPALAAVLVALTAVMGPVGSCEAAAAVQAGQAVAWNEDILKQPAAWYVGQEARRSADAVVARQSPEGAWPKNIDLLAPEPAAGDDPSATNTFDNDAFALPMKFLALVSEATGDETYTAAFNRGLTYVLAAQYPNGGWPQFYPLREGYYSHITFNDDAMVRSLTLLRHVARGDAPYGFVDPARRVEAAEAVEKGVDLILRTQIRRDGLLTGWCAQYDETTLAPAWARRFEPPSISGSESVGIVRFLMGEPSTPQVRAAVEGAVAWFKASALRDVRLERFTNDEGRPDRRLVSAPGAALLWARFHDLETGKPIYLGRDSIPRTSLAEIEYERRNGYSYVGSWPQNLISTEYPRWRHRNGLD